MTAKKILNRRSMRLASGGGAVPGGRIDELSAAMMLNVAGEIIMAQDGSGTITLMNESGHRILGYEYPELLGRNWFDVRLPEETRPELRALFERLKLRPTDEVVMHEDALLNRRGERKIIRWRNVVLRDGSGAFIGLFSSGEDITERRATEAALRESRERLEFALEGSKLGEWDWNIKTNKLVRNERWAQMLGYSLAEIKDDIEQGINLQHPDDRAGSWQAIQDHLSGKTEYYDITYRMRARDGSYRWIHDCGKIVERDDEGNPVRLCGTHADVTDQKRAEERINALLAEKELLLKEVHHRIKNYMNTMMSLLSLQASSATDGYARDALVDAGKRMQAMALLYEELYMAHDFRKAQVGEYLSALVDRIVANFPNSPAVGLGKHFDDIMLDARQLQPLGIIINELLTNTMKYAFAGRTRGLVSVSTRLSGGLVAVVVEDDGVGLPADFSLERSKGFGLQLVRGLMQQLRGTMRVESGTGTRVVLEFKPY